MILAKLLSAWALQSFLAWGLYWGDHNKTHYSNYRKAGLFDILFPLVPVSFIVMLFEDNLSWAWGPLTKLQRYRIFCERFPHYSELYTYNTFDDRGY